MSLLTSLAGGPFVIAVAVAVLFLIIGLLLLKVGTAHKPKQETPSETPAQLSPSDTVRKSEEIPPDRPKTQPRPKALRQIPLQWSDDYGRRHTKLVHVVDSSEADFSLMVEDDFKPGQTVWLADEDVLRRGAVKFIEKGAGPRRMDVHLIEKERRTHERELGAGEATLYWTEKRRVEHTTRVTIRNFSEDDLQVQARVALSAGQAVVLKGRKLNSPAVVLYSEPEGDHYLLGLRFTGAPHTRAFVPEPPREEPTEPEDTNEPEETSGSDAEFRSVSALAKRLSRPPRAPARRLALSVPGRV